MKKATINGLETEVEYSEDLEQSPNICIESVTILGAAFCLDDLSESAFEEIRFFVREVIKK